MENRDLIDQIRELFSDIAQSIVVPEIQTNRVDVFIQPEDLIQAVNRLKINDWGYLITISAYDTLDESGVPQIGLAYHFGEEGIICSLRFYLSHAEPSIESICPVIPSATVYERECMELYGIDFRNTSDRSKLLLPENWPDGVYPMLKSFKGLSDEELERMEE